MDFRYSPEEEAFRSEVSTFLDKDLTEEIARQNWRDKGLGPEGREFALKLGAKGWLGINWPKEYGGQGKSQTYQYILLDELGKRWGAHVPNDIALLMAGPIILHHGSEQLKQEILPRILRGEIEFGLGYTEPQAGSDLASMEMRAVDHGDYFLVNGQKMFNTESHYADYHWLAARTDPDAPKHRGISLFVVDQRAPGITIRPMWTLCGERTNEVFYDDVKVPKSRLVGEKNRGFYYMMGAVDYERLTIISSVRLQYLFDEIAKYAKETKRGGQPLVKDPVIRSKLAQMAIELEVARMLEERARWLVVQGKPINYEAAMVKVVVTELEKRLVNVGGQVLGLYAQLHEDSKWVALNGRIEWHYLSAFIQTIGAGTNEICRNIMATRGLGLPRA